jgi:hypothetical protein
MAQSDMTGTDANRRDTSAHRGSAPANPSGRVVLAAWIISIAVHATLFFGMTVLVFPSSAGEEPDLPVTHADILGPVAPTPFVPSQVPDLRTGASVLEPHEPRLMPKKFAQLSDLGMLKKPQLPIIAIHGGRSDLAKYGLAANFGGGAEFFGLRGSAAGARKIIYVVDRSGSMIDTFAYVQAELKRSISALRRSQKFHVILFNAGEPLENPSKRLVSAIDAHKEQFFEFLDTVVARGGTRPEAAMRRALAMEPDLIYLLSDGVDFRPSLFQRLDEWNKQRRVRIYTIAYLDQTGSELLERIAREHNGEFKFVSEDEL